jgi:hypothetical protein
MWSDHIDSTVEEPRLLGRVRRHPQDAGRWGLQNLSDLTWQVRLPDGRTDALTPGKSVEIIPGLQLEVGRVSAVVRALQPDSGSVRLWPDSSGETVVTARGGV